MHLKPGLIGSLILSGLTWLASGWAWFQLPAGARLPVHWGLSGAADRYAGKFEGLALMPLVILAVSGLFALLPRIEPRRLHLQQSWRAYTAVWIAVVALLAGLQGVVLLVAFGAALDVTALASAGVGGLLVVIGLSLRHVRSNFMFGIRTPWTLTSERSWRDTHRLGGWLFAASGLALMAAALSGSAVFALWASVALVALLVAGLFAYSYVIWRNDQQGPPVGV